MENQFTSVERLTYYSTKLEQEANFHTDDPSTSLIPALVLSCSKVRALGTIPLVWPSQGKVEFDNVEARYKPDGAPVVKNLSFKTMPAEKIGIGTKSSLCNPNPHPHQPQSFPFRTLLSKTIAELFS